MRCRSSASRCGRSRRPASTWAATREPWPGCSSRGPRWVASSRRRRLSSTRRAASPRWASPTSSCNGHAPTSPSRAGSRCWRRSRAIWTVTDSRDCACEWGRTYRLMRTAEAARRKGRPDPMRTHYVATTSLDDARLAKDLEQSESFVWSEAYSDYLFGGAWKSCMLWARGGDTGDGVVTHYAYDQPSTFTPYGNQLPYLRELITA